MKSFVACSTWTRKWRSYFAPLNCIIEVQILEVTSMGLCGCNLKEMSECSNAIHEGTIWHQIRIGRSCDRQNSCRIVQMKIRRNIRCSKRTWRVHCRWKACSVWSFAGSYRQSYCMRWNNFALLRTTIIHFKRRLNLIEIVESRVLELWKFETKACKPSSFWTSSIKGDLGFVQREQVKQVPPGTYRRGWSLCSIWL